MVENGESAGAEVEQKNVQPFEILVPELIGESKHEGNYHQGKHKKAQTRVEEELSIYGLIYAHGGWSAIK